MAWYLSASHFPAFLPIFYFVALEYLRQQNKRISIQSGLMSFPYLCWENSSIHDKFNIKNLISNIL